jgi:extracellular factor (EF) 3-hydroxypalmitic acid methyl ester biosynthesis protein
MITVTALRAAVNDFCQLENSLPQDPLESYHLVSAAIHQLGVSIRQAESSGLDAPTLREVLAPAIALHGQSPLINRLQTWPRGYPGDFETIEYLCSAQNGAHAGSLSYFIEQVALHSAVTQQHRNKVAWQASEILRVSVPGTSSKRVLSIACGGSRDIRSVQPLLVDANVEIYLNDMDTDALAKSTSSLSALGNRVTALPGDVIRATRQFVRLAPFDLIVAGGLFDYLDDERLRWLIPKLHACLRTDGNVCFTNLATGNPARAWMEYLCNWKIIERSEDDVLHILASSGLDDYRVAIERDTTGLALLVKVTKAPGCRTKDPRTPTGLGSDRATPATPASSTVADSPIQVAVATSEARREEVHRFCSSGADRERKPRSWGADGESRIPEPQWDRSGEYIYAARGDTIVGTMRRNVLAAVDIPPMVRDIFQLDRFLADFSPQSLTMSSPPLLTPGAAGERAAALLYSYHYQTLRDQGIQFDFVCVGPAVIGSYEQLGYRRYGSNFPGATTGLRVPMVLVVEDVDHLHRVRSPLLRSSRTVPSRTDAAEWFCAVFPEQSRFFNRRTMERSAFWSMWGSTIRESPAHPAQLFAGLTDAEIQLFLHEASVHRISAGETIVRTGDVGDEMFIVLSGVAEAIVAEEGGHRLFRELQHGDVFGEIAMFLGSVRSASVRAITDVEVLIINKEQLTDSLTSMPKIASRVLLNLVRCLCSRLVENTSAARPGQTEHSV